jgi:hypothetical protein
LESKVRSRLLLLAAASASLIPFPGHAERTELNTPVVTQQTPVWCWAATASMALRLLGFPDINPARNYQCGVVAAAFRKCEDDCTKCVTSLGSMTKLVAVLDRYKRLSLERGSASGRLSPNYVSYPRWHRIKRSLDFSYPVIAGISPDGKPAHPAESEHTVLITGYDDDYSRHRRELGDHQGSLSIRARRKPLRGVPLRRGERDRAAAVAGPARSHESHIGRVSRETERRLIIAAGSHLGAGGHAAMRYFGMLMGT